MPQFQGKASVDATPSEVANAANVQVATDEFGALHVRSEERVWAEQGTHYRTTNATPGTGIASTITTAFSATAALLVMKSSSATKKIMPHYIRLINTVAGASTTSSRAAISIDTASRYPGSGGTDLTTQIVNSHSGLAPASALSVIQFGAVVTAAVSSPKYLANFALKTQAAPCWTIGDEVLITFGDSGNAGLISGTAAISIVKSVGPVILSGNNHSLVLHVWNPANASTAPSWEVEIAWWER